MKEVLKILLCYGMVLGLSVNTYGIHVYGNSKSTYSTKVITYGETNALNLRDTGSEDSILLDKLEYDKENHSTELSEDIEEQLNEVGLFDSEIQQLDDETVEHIENSAFTQVSVIYYKEDKETGEKIEMKQEEVDSLIEEKIEEGEMEYEKEDVNLLSNTFIGIGILPVEVKAKSNTVSDTDYSPSGAVKSYLIVSQTKSGGKIYVSYTSTWLKEAYYREKDVLGVSMTNASYDKTSLNCDHWVTYTYTNTNGKYSYYEEKKHTKPTKRKTKDRGFAYTVDLFGDRKKMKACMYAGVIEHYVGEFITISFTCDPISKSGKYCVFSTSYNHWEAEKTVTPSISISTGGTISVGVSGGKKNYYHELDGNAYVKYKYI